MFTTHKLQGAGGVGGGAYFLAEAKVASSQISVRGIDVDSSGNIVFCGDYSGNDIVGIVDSSGNLTMNKSFIDIHSNPSSCRSVKYTSSGNIVGAFDSASNELLIEFQLNGTVNWSKFTDFAGIYTHCSMVINSAGDIYTYGSHVQSPYAAADYDVVMSKYNSSGVRQISQLNNTGYYQFVSDGDVALDSAGNFYFTMQFYDSSGPNEWGFSWIRKLNSGLGTAGGWIKTKGVASNTNYTTLASVAVDSSDYVIGVGRAVGAPYAQPYIVKYDSYGNDVWQRQFAIDNGDNYFAHHVATDSSNNIYVGCSHGFLLKYNSSGTLQWKRRIKLGAAWPTNLIMSFDNDNDAVIVGASGYIAKLPADGSGMGTYGNFIYYEPVGTSSTASLSSQYAVGSIVYNGPTDSNSVSSSSDQAITLTTNTI